MIPSLHVASWLICAVVATLVAQANVAIADENSDAKEKPVSLAEGKLTLTAPKGWIAKKPSIGFIEAEFSTPATEGDGIDGRLTIMRAGGGVEANIDRWIGQFSQPDGKPTRERSVVKKDEIGGQEVHLVDISGTYADARGPFAPAVQREDYRMLGAIIDTERLGQYFIKYYGPKKTVAANEKAFHTFVKSLKVKEKSKNEK